MILRFRFLRALLCAVILQSQLISISQVEEPFDSLDLSGIDFFWPQTWQNIPLPDPYSFDDSLSGSASANLFIRFDKACLDSSAYIGSYEEIRDGMIKVAESFDVIPVALLDINHHDFVDSVLTDSILLLIDGKS